jgi:hypothetical protein
VLRSEEEKPTYFVLNSILVPRTSEVRHNTVVDGCNLVQLSSSGMSGALPRLKRLIEVSNHTFETCIGEGRIGLESYKDRNCNSPPFRERSLTQEFCRWLQLWHRN